MKNLRSGLLRNVVVLACLYAAGAVVLARVGMPDALARLTASEAVHIPAHTILYGGLAWLARRWGAGPRAAIALAVSVGLAQELAQVAAFERQPGLPELFDLGVDALAATLAVALHGRRERGKISATSKPPASPRASSPQASSPQASSPQASSPQASSPQASSA